MKTISKHDGKNYEIDVKGDLHEYPDGTIFEVKNGKLIPGKGGGLPDASDYADGTALIAKDGAFIPSTGYGYLMPDTTVTWDGRYRESRDLLLDASGEYYYISPLGDVIPPSVNLVGSVEREFGGESETDTQQIVFAGESAGSYKSWGASSLMLYGVLSDSFWGLFGAPSLGTGLFMFIPLPSATFDDGACVAPKASTQSGWVYYDSFHLDLTIPGAKQTIDRNLIGGLVYTVTVSGDRSTCDKTAEEIFKAYTNGPVHFVQSGRQSRYTTRSLLLRAKAPMYNSGSEYAFYVWHNDEGGTLDADKPGSMRIYTASAGNEHPTLYTTGSHEEPVI